MLEILFGYATFYAPGVMEQVIANRVSWGQIQYVEPWFAIAVLDCHRIGQKAMIEWNGSMDGPYTIVDCAREADKPELERRRVVVDVSWQIAKRHKMKGPTPVRLIYLSGQRTSLRMREDHIRIQ